MKPEYLSSAEFVSSAPTYIATHILWEQYTMAVHKIGSDAALEKPLVRLPIRAISIDDNGEAAVPKLLI